MIQPVPKSNKEEKSISRQVNLAVTSPPVTTKYLHWSEQPIEFNREDHPITVPRPGNAPVVLKSSDWSIRCRKSIQGCRKWDKPDLHKNTSSNTHIAVILKANRLLLPWNRTRKCQLPTGSNSTRRLLRQPPEL
jgi:hypothetical protein